MKMTTPTPTMSSLAQPATLIGIADAVGVLGVFVYNYKKIGALQEELEKIKTQLNTSISRVTNQILEIDKHIAQFGMLCAKLQETVISVRNKQKRMEYRQNIIITALKRADVEFKGDLSLHESSRRSGDDDDENSEEEEEEKDSERNSRSKRGGRRHVRFGEKSSEDMNDLVMKASRSNTS